MFVFLPPAVLLLVLFYIARVIYNARNSLSKLSHLPWVGLEDSSWLELVKCRFKNAKGFNVAVTAAFEQYSSQGKACVIPTLANDLIALPPAELEWLIAQPDYVLNAKVVQFEALQFKYTMTDQFIGEDPLHREIIKRDLTRRLGDLTSDIIDELASSIDDEWGTDTNTWKEVVPFTTLMRVVARTSNRVFVGLPLCRDPVLLESGKGFATQVPVSALMLRQFPSWSRPTLAKVFTRKGKKYSRDFIDCIRPTILARQADLHNPTKEKPSQQPNDFLQWLISAASQSPNLKNNDPSILGGRMLNLNFAAIHTSTFSITNAIFDLVAPPCTHQTISELREEANGILTANDGIWTKQGLAQMVKTDSALRESSRLGSFLAVGLVRKVLAPEGLTSPISKTYLPPGSQVCVLTTGIHTSEATYADATTYKPFRFSDVRSAPDHAAAAATSASKEADSSSEPLSYLSRASLSFVSTSPVYHPFGHGRHACPGRFFAANELKLLLAYLVQNYDFEMLDKRPNNKWLGTSVLPPMTETIRVRRRANSS